MSILKNRTALNNTRLRERESELESDRVSKRSRARARALAREPWWNGPPPAGAAQASEENSDDFEVNRYDLISGKRVHPAGSIWGPQARPPLSTPHPQRHPAPLVPNCDACGGGYSA